MTSQPSGAKRTYRAKQSGVGCVIALFGVPLAALTTYVAIKGPTHTVVGSVLWLVLFLVAAIVGYWFVASLRSTVTITDLGILVRRPGLRDFEARWFELKHVVITTEVIANKVTVKVGFGASSSTTRHVNRLVVLERDSGKKYKIYENAYEGGEQTLRTISDYYMRYLPTSNRPGDLG